MTDKQKAIESKLATLGHQIHFSSFEIDDENDCAHLVYEYDSKKKKLNIEGFFSYYNRENIIVDLILLEIDHSCFSISSSVFERYVSNEEDLQLIKRVANQSLRPKNTVCSISKMKDKQILEANILVRDDAENYHDYDLILLDLNGKTIGQLIAHIVESVNQKWEEK